MKNLQFTATKKQSNEIKALAYWIADVNYIRERFGDDEPELLTCDQTIKAIFEKLDILGVPFWVQNEVIFFAENWRAYKSQYLENAMAAKNIHVA